ncbi:MAG TPA: glycosyl transferase family 2, partial [Clostridiales bacterium]|nr:glycosyl transferase family 2 [Clostridiales bacterium]
FSILLSIKDHQKETLSKAILGLKNQIYPHWELTILSNPSNKDTFEDAFTLICAGDPRCKRIYYQIQDDENAALNSALERCDGDFFIHLQPNQILREHALYLVATAINQHPEVDAIYTDEDKLDQNNQRCSPFFKPDWNPDMFLSQNLFSGLGAFRTDVVKDASGFSKTADVDHNWDLALRIIEKIPASHIRHVPHICVHIKQIQEINKSKPDKDQRYQTLIAHFMRLHIPVEILQTGNQYWHIRFPIPDPQPLVSIIIPTKDQVQLLKVCLESIDYKTTYSNYEILVVNNQSTDPEALAYYDDIKQKEYITLLDYDQPFNYAAINNTAVKHANGDVLIFLNDDTKVISPHWLEELVSHALRKEIGAVGAMLYFPDDSIQHAGIILNPEIIAGHAFYLQPQAFRGQNDRVQYAQNYSAVTAACMAVEKSKFLAVSGFDEENLTIAYNDIDFCLKLVEAGYYNLWTPYAEVYHHESVSRGYDQDIGKHERLQKEANYLRTRWKNKINNDPAYHPNLKGYPLFSLVDPPGVEKPWKDFIAGQH